MSQAQVDISHWVYSDQDDRIRRFEKSVKEGNAHLAESSKLMEMAETFGYKPHGEVFEADIRVRAQQEILTRCYPKQRMPIGVRAAAEFQHRAQSLYYKLKRKLAHLRAEGLMGLAEGECLDPSALQCESPEPTDLELIDNVSPSPPTSIHNAVVNVGDEMTRLRGSTIFSASSAFDWDKKSLGEEPFSATESEGSGRSSEFGVCMVTGALQLGNAGLTSRELQDIYMRDYAHSLSPAEVEVVQGSS
ncbi:hypothetical protein OBBRIDRAFT_889345 [Obba rivulosa]|uniref:Uncharacterized protein n=1 Tax=Obba rivulosa TaxID=1052685 RepID=A0A8E2AWU5_9APHY|nr:hypothetical protein OBBRIDRAFT_889345 [Obba rivulosa]